MHVGQRVSNTLRNKRNRVNRGEWSMRALNLLAICAMAAAATSAGAQEIDWKKVDEAIGRSPAAVGGDVHRYDFLAAI